MTNIAQQNAFSFRIRFEELFFILHTLEFNTLPGLGTDPFDHLSSERKAQMLAGGFNSLRAKGWAQLLPNVEHPIGLDRLLVLPVVACTTSRQVLSITRQPPDSPGEHLLVFQSPDLLVMYRLVEAGIYEFIVTADHEELIAFLLGIVISSRAATGSQSVHTGAFSLNRSEANTLLDFQKRKNITGIRELLESSHVPEHTIENYIETLTGLQYSVMLSFIEFPEDVASIDRYQGWRINVIVGEKSIWTIRDADNETLELQCTKANDLENIISKWIRTAANRRNDSVS